MKSTVLLLALIAAGIFCLWLGSVQIGDASLRLKDGTQMKITLPYEAQGKRPNERFFFSFSVVSKIAQEVRLHITADDEIAALFVNGKRVGFGEIRRQYGQQKLKDYTRGYNFDVGLSAGANSVRVVTKNYGGGYTLKIARGYFFRDFLLFFLLVIVPAVILTVDALHRSMPKLAGWKTRLYGRAAVLNREGRLLRRLPAAIIVLGIALRVAYLFIYGHASYQHDRHYHIEFIRYFAQQWALPLPDKALEFPQQPLYYFLTGKLYALLSAFGVSQENILTAIASLSTLMMSAVLFVAAGTIRQLTSSAFVLNTALGFLAFTPSLLFLAGQINNDPMNYFLATLGLYWIVRYHNGGEARAFAWALLFSALVFLTKVSSGLIAMMLFFVLLRRYFAAGTAAGGPPLRHLRFFGIVMLFLLGFSFWRVYLPSTGEFLFVNSGVFSGQEIVALNADYFLSFRIADLIGEGQAYVYDTLFAPVKQSFFTWQYATMLLGEYDYKRVMESLFLNRMVYVTGLVYVVGLFAFVYHIRTMPLMVKFFVPAVAINQLLIVNFALRFPSVCNTDFRYNSPTILLWSVILAFGLYRLSGHGKHLKRLVITAVVAANVAQAAWIVQLLLLGRPNTIT